MPHESDSEGDFGDAHVPSSTLSGRSRGSAGYMAELLHHASVSSAKQKAERDIKKLDPSLPQTKEVLKLFQNLIKPISHANKGTPDTQGTPNT
jgi:hypothetical protein